MKILLLNQVFYPDHAATAQHSTDLAIFLTRKGHEITVVTGIRGYEDRKISYSPSEIYQGIKIHRVRSTGLGKKSFLTRVIDSLTFDAMLLAKLFTLPKYDVVIAFTSPPLIATLAMIFTAIKGGKLVQWQMDINPEAAIAVGYLKPGSLVSRVLTAIFRFTLLHSFRIIVLDRWMKRKIENYGVPPEQIVVIPPWPVHEFKGPTEAERVLRVKSNPFRTELGLEGKFIILYSGNHSIVHPLDTLLDAAKALKDRSDIAFVFIGGGLRMQDVERARDNFKLKNIHILPFQPREKLVFSLGLGNLHVVVMGNEMTGLVHASKIYGVLATGLPWVGITPQASHLVDVLDECPYGFQAQHGDVAGLLDVIEKAKALSESDLAKYNTGNVNYVLSKFTRDGILSDFYEQVIAAADESGELRKKIAPTEIGRSAAR